MILRRWTTVRELIEELAMEDQNAIVAKAIGEWPGADFEVETFSRTAYYDYLNKRFLMESNLQEDSDPPIPPDRDRIAMNITLPDKFVGYEERQIVLI